MEPRPSSPPWPATKPSPRTPWTRRAVAGLLVVATFATAGCLRTVHDTIYVYPDLAQPDLAQPDLVMPVHAQAIFVVQLGRASANLAPAYAAIINGLRSALATNLVFVDEWAVLPLTGPRLGSPAFVAGGSNSLLAPKDLDLAAVLAGAAQSGAYDAPAAGITAEQGNLADIAFRLDSATLPPDQNGGQSVAAFSSPLDRMLVVTISPARRRCALDDPACRIDGQPPATYFSTSDWIRMAGGYVPAWQIDQLFLVTGEEETAQAFAARCAAVPGFPRTLLDVMEPSPVGYYGPLAGQLAGSGLSATRLDLCDLLGSSGSIMLQQLALQVRR